MSTVRSVLAGYAFDGLAFQRAAVNRHGEVAVKETGVPINMDPYLLLWYTRREFQNAVAWCQSHQDSKGQPFLPRDIDLNTVFPTPALMGRLKDQGHLRDTKQHILHLLTAGKERVLGVRFTDAEIAGYDKQAQSLLDELNKVFSAKAQISA